MQILIGDRVRISLGGDLSTIFDTENINCSFQDAHQIIRREFRGRTPAEEYRMQRPLYHPGCFKSASGKENLSCSIVRIRTHPYPVTKIFGGISVKITIPTSHRAERNMYVEAKITVLTPVRTRGRDASITRRGRANRLRGCHTMPPSWESSRVRVRKNDG